jgi:hypothetical protein
MEVKRKIEPEYMKKKEKIGGFIQNVERSTNDPEENFMPEKERYFQEGWNQV